MKTLFYHIISLVLIAAIAVGCTSNTINKCGPCPLYAIVLPHINFRIVDKTTGDDLFFAAVPKYKISQLKFHSIINGKPDTAFLSVDSLDKKFTIFITNKGPVDTVTMQVADKPQDILLFTAGKTAGCCSVPFLSSVVYNGTTVFTHENGPGIVILTK